MMQQHRLEMARMAEELLELQRQLEGGGEEAEGEGGAAPFSSCGGDGGDGDNGSSSSPSSSSSSSSSRPSAWAPDSSGRLDALKRLTSRRWQGTQQSGGAGDAGGG